MDFRLYACFDLLRLNGISDLLRFMFAGFLVAGLVSRPSGRRDQQFSCSMAAVYLFLSAAGGSKTSGGGKTENLAKTMALAGPG